jgi:hypothetical protein
MKLHSLNDIFERRLLRIILDLDDDVKVNYGKFGNLLADVKAIHGKAER